MTDIASVHAKAVFAAFENSLTDPKRILSSAEVAL